MNSPECQPYWQEVKMVLSPNQQFWQRLDDIETTLLKTRHSLPAADKKSFRTQPIFPLRSIPGSMPSKGTLLWDFSVRRKEILFLLIKPAIQHTNLLSPALFQGCQPGPAAEVPPKSSGQQAGMKHWQALIEI